MRIPNMVGDVDVLDVIGPHEGGMICEAHPEREWPHDDCPGPGMQLSNRIAALVWQRDDARRRLAAVEADPYDHRTDTCPQCRAVAAAQELR